MARVFTNLLIELPQQLETQLLSPKEIRENTNQSRRIKYLFMTPTVFAIVLGCIGFLSGLLGFSEDIAKFRGFRFVDTLLTKLIVLFIATVGTIYATTLYNKKSDEDNELKLHKQDSTATAKQNWRDSVNNRHIDSINNHTAELLAKYHFTVDSANDVLRRTMDTSMGKTFPNVSPITDESAIAKFKWDDSSTYRFPLGFKNFGNSIAYDTHLNYRIITKLNETFICPQIPTKAFGDISMNLGMQENYINGQIINFGKLTAKDSLFIVIDISYKNANGKSYHKNEVYLLLPYKNELTGYIASQNLPLFSFLKKKNL